MVGLCGWSGGGGKAWNDENVVPRKKVVRE